MPTFELGTLQLVFLPFPCKCVCSARVSAGFHGPDGGGGRSEVETTESEVSETEVELDSPVNVRRLFPGH